MSAHPQPHDPMTTQLRIVRGAPTPEELAALAAVVTTAGTNGRAEPPQPQRGRWNDPAHNHRRYWQPGPGAWKAAARP